VDPALDLAELTVLSMFEQFDASVDSLYSMIDKLESLGDGFYRCINELGEDALGITPVDVEVKDGITRVVAEFRKTTLLQLSKFKLGYIIKHIDKFKELIDNTCALVPGTDVTAAINLVLGEVGTKVSAKDVCTMLSAVIKNVLLLITTTIDSLVKMIDFKLLIDDKYNGFVGWQYDYATYENVLRLMNQ